jgi:hypothetical protein
MVRRGGIGVRQIRRDWPHRVELPEEAVRGAVNSAATFGMAKELGAAPYPLPEFRDDWHWTIFHFKTAAHAQAFHQRFGGEPRPVAEENSTWTEPKQQFIVAFDVLLLFKLRERSATGVVGADVTVESVPPVDDELGSGSECRLPEQDSLQRCERGWRRLSPAGRFPR